MKPLTINLLNNAFSAMESFGVRVQDVFSDIEYYHNWIEMMIQPHTGEVVINYDDMGVVACFWNASVHIVDVGADRLILSGCSDGDYEYRTIATPPFADIEAKNGVFTLTLHLDKLPEKAWDRFYMRANETQDALVLE